VFFLRVKGDSMVGRGILHDDYVLVHRQDAKNGDIVAARIGDEATIKTLRHQNGKVVLEPANPSEKEIVVEDGEDFAVLGVACGVFRPFREIDGIDLVDEPRTDA
jgi:repressor LexA